MTSFFGTDGVRGRANRWPMDPPTMTRLAQAAAAIAMPQTGCRRVLIGRDTRISGPMIECALNAGFLSAGVNVALVGELPTPGVSALVARGEADLGVVISASHNPFDDNGVKLFGPDGRKLSDDAETAIAAAVLRDAAPARTGAVGRLETHQSAGALYTKMLRLAVGSLDLSGMKIVIDAANGAAHAVAPAVLGGLGAEVAAIACAPDGRNINAGCGATTPCAVGAAVRAAGADIGVALDGDADRVIICDEAGDVLDGDQIIGAIAQAWAQDGRLRGGAVVATVMSNGGLVAFLETLGVGLLRTPVGDRHVAARMAADGVNLGGEQSGHIIMSDYASTGDGLLAALHFLSLLRADGRPVSAVGRVFTPWPQRLVNVACTTGSQPLDHPQIAAAIAAAEAALRPRGRVLIRKSGTEPLIRVMTEGEDAAVVDAQADAVARAVKAAGPVAA